MMRNHWYNVTCVNFEMRVILLAICPYELYKI